MPNDMQFEPRRAPDYDAAPESGYITPEGSEVDYQAGTQMPLDQYSHQRTGTQPSQYAQQSAGYPIQQTAIQYNTNYYPSSNSSGPGSVKSNTSSRSNPPPPPPMSTMPADDDYYDHHIVTRDFNSMNIQESHTSTQSYDSHINVQNNYPQSDDIYGYDTSIPSIVPPPPQMTEPVTDIAPVPPPPSFTSQTPSYAPPPTQFQTVPPPAPSVTESCQYVQPTDSYGPPPPQVHNSYQKMPNQQPSYQTMPNQQPSYQQTPNQQQMYSTVSATPPAPPPQAVIAPPPAPISAVVAPPPPPVQRSYAPSSGVPSPPPLMSTIHAPVLVPSNTSPPVVYSVPHVKSTAPPPAPVAPPAPPVPHAPHMSPPVAPPMTPPKAPPMAPPAPVAPSSPLHHTMADRHTSQAPQSQSVMSQIASTLPHLHLRQQQQQQQQQQQTVLPTNGYTQQQQHQQNISYAMPPPPPPAPTTPYNSGGEFPPPPPGQGNLHSPDKCVPHTMPKPKPKNSDSSAAGIIQNEMAALNKLPPVLARLQKPAESEPNRPAPSVNGVDSADSGLPPPVAPKSVPPAPPAKPSVAAPPQQMQQYNQGKFNSLN